MTQNVQKKSTTSILMSLPISCNICLSKVKEPTLCENLHVFCKVCLGEWKKKCTLCPVCRTSIEHTKEIIGGSSEEEAHAFDMADRVMKSQMRKTRLNVIFEEFQNEMDALEETVLKLTEENKALTEVNKQLSEQFSKTSASKTCSSSQGISTILKLSSKLQQAMEQNEKLSQTNKQLKEEILTVNSEKECLLKDIKKIKENDTFSASPQKYNKYAMIALQTKNESYERELQQWRRAMSRADSIIEELTADLEQQKQTTYTDRFKTLLSNQPVDPNRVDSSREGIDSSRVGIDSSRVGIDSSRDNNSYDPIRFPACSRLIELTKARSSSGGSTVRNLFGDSTPTNEAVTSVSSHNTPVAMNNNTTVSRNDNLDPVSTKRIKVEA